MSVIQHQSISPALPRRLATLSLLCLSGATLVTIPDLTLSATQAATPTRSRATAVKRSMRRRGPQAARAALAQSRRLMATGALIPGANALVEEELRRAVALAPRWLEARRELARFYSRQGRWTPARKAWRAVLALKRGDREARAALFHNKSARSASMQTVGRSRTGRAAARSWTEQNAALAPALVTSPGTQSPDAILLAALPEASADVIQATPLSPDSASVMKKAPAGVPKEAWVALARARQLIAANALVAGADTIAGWELQRAASVAPQWLDAQRELARWYSRRGESSAAAIAWRAVLALRPQDREARAEFERTRQHLAYSPWVGREVVTLGVPDTKVVGRYTTSLAQTRPSVATPPAPTRLAAAPPITTGSTSPATEDEAAAGVAAPPRTNGGTTTLPSAPETAPPPAAPPTAPLPSSVLPVPEPTMAPAIKTGPSSAPAMGRARSIARPVARKTTQSTKPAARAVTRRATSQRRGAASKRRGVSNQRQAAAWALVERAGNLMKAKRFAEALPIYQRAFALNPLNPFAQWGVAEAAMIVRDYNLSAIGYRRILFHHPGHSRALRGLADVLTYAKRYEEAIRVNQALLAQNPKDVKANYQIAQILTWTNRASQADPYYSAALEADEPQNLEGLLTWGEILSYNRDPRAVGAFQRALRLAPNNERALLGLARSYAWISQYDNAIAQYQTLLNQNVSNETRLQALLGQGDAYSFSERFPQAIEPYQKALEVDPNSIEAHLGLGRAQAIIARYPEAVEHLSVVVQAQPKNTEALKLLALAQTDLNKEAALARYQTLLPLQTDPRDQAETLGEIAALHAQLGHPEEARQAYEDALQRAPDNSDVAIQYVQWLIKEGKQWERARSLVSKVLEREPGNVRALTQQIVVEHKLNYPDRVNALAERLEALEPPSPDVALQMVYALRDVNKPQAARRVLLKLAALPIDAATNPVMALQVATGLRDAGEYDLADKAYQRLLATDPNNLQAHLDYAQMLSWQKKTDAAQQQLDYILNRKPGGLIETEAQVESAKLKLVAVTPANLEAAKVAAMSILEKDPGSPVANLVMAQASTAGGQFENAIKYYRTVLKSDPNNLEARLGLARNLYWSKQTEDAIQEYQALMQRTPNDFSLKLELAQLYLDQNRYSDAEALYNQ
ncbi:MAG: tetratricopeptide repeat protein, partial [Armatimonadota bacterium]|nr:tetratricopeptide repeat protein [Armatimonadota bacterium]